MTYLRTFPRSFLSGTLGNLPSAGVLGQFYLATDTSPVLLHMWDGDRWQQIASWAQVEAPSDPISGEPASTGTGDYKIIQYDSGDTAIAEYEASDVGLQSALVATADGDALLLPPGTYIEDYTIPAGATIRGVARDEVIFSGLITLSSGSVLRSATVERTASDATTLKGVIGSSSGEAVVRDCDIRCTQSGSGNTYAVWGGMGGDLSVQSSVLYANASGSGSGYCAGMQTAGSGDLYIEHCVLEYSTDVTDV